MAGAGSGDGSGRSPFEAVVFDIDGILIESEHLWDEVRRDMAAQHDLAWPDEATTAMMGMSTQEWSAYMAGDVGVPGSPEQVADRVIDAMAARYQIHLPVLPGAAEAVRRMAEQHRVALASSSPRRLIDAVVAGLDVGSVLGATVSTEEVGRGKPAPDGYLRACELLGVDPGRAVGVEDSSNGCRSVLAAGMTLIAVPPTFHPPSPELLTEAAAVLDGLDELTDDLLRRIAPAPST